MINIKAVKGPVLNRPYYFINGESVEIIFSVPFKFYLINNVEDIFLGLKVF